jgi:hypothetical protein
MVKGEGVRNPSEHKDGEKFRKRSQPRSPLVRRGYERQRKRRMDRWRSAHPLQEEAQPGGKVLEFKKSDIATEAIPGVTYRDGLEIRTIEFQEPEFVDGFREIKRVQAEIDYGLSFDSRAKDMVDRAGRDCRRIAFFK